ncbi:MAG: S8/S53 family peptidase [Spirochaetales bacterium]|nr:S8/S53 family peptidase [Spirochaetales bacterium]
MIKIVFATFLVVLSWSCVKSTTEIPTYSVEKFQDLRGVILQRNEIDLRSYDLRANNLSLTVFDTFTAWPERKYLPKDFDPQKFLDIGKAPGLGISKLHQQGITGSGVNVAIIDQPLLLDHIEYKGKILSYKEIDTDKAGPQMHGPAVTSILCGNNCGVAPGVNIFYFAIPSWKRDYKYYIKALEEIIAYNNGKTIDDQIRVVSISKGFSSDEPNLDKWKETINEAESKGIYVIHCSDNIFGIGCPIDMDRDNFVDYGLCNFYQSNTFRQQGFLFAPVDNRTYARWMETDAYTFDSMGGLSWAAPYITGVAALGLQVKSDLVPGEIRTHLYETGYSFQNGRIVDPISFIEKLRDL